jgi:hypothetical protein
MGMIATFRIGASFSHVFRGVPGKQLSIFDTNDVFEICLKLCSLLNISSIMPK